MADRPGQGGAESHSGSRSQAVPERAAAVLGELGEEADDGEQAAMRRVLAGYLRALAGDRWGRACSALADEPRRQLTALGKRAKRRGVLSEDAGCPQILGGVQAEVPAELRQRMARANLTGGWVRGGHGFIAFEPDGESVGFFPMTRKGDDWRVGAIAASNLPPAPRG